MIDRPTRNQTMPALLYGVLLSAALLLPGAAAAADLPTPAIQEWPVPWEATRPRDPDVGPDGNVWFVGQRGHYVASLDPASGEFRRLELDQGTGPHNLIVADDGTIWYAGNLASHIGRMDPRTGAIHKVMMPDPAARDPHTLVFDGAGDIWFSVQGGNMLGKLTVATEAVRLIPVPTERARPYGIVVAPSGDVWATAFGSNKLLHVDPATMHLEEVALPRADARPRRLQATEDGRIWYVDYAMGMLGFLHPESGLIKEWALPGGADSQPYGMAVDAANRLWMVESGLSPNRLVGFDPVTETFTAPVAIPSGGGTVRHMAYDAATDSIWFGTDTNTIGRADLSP
jgi:virginiamycin B lyase